MGLHYQGHYFCAIEIESLIWFKQTNKKDKLAREKSDFPRNI